MTQQNLFPSPVFQERSNYKPFDYPWAFEAYDLQQKMHWLPHEVPLAEDVKDWISRLSDRERDLLTQLFRFFTQADTDISEGYAARYIPQFPKPELRMMLMAIAASEANHMHSYSLLIDTLGLPDEEYVAFREYKAMADKHDYMFKRKVEGLSQEEATALDLAVFSAFGEGLQLFSTFAILMNFQRLGKMKGMSTIVEWSIRDECVTGDTEVLTPSGWVAISELESGISVAQYNHETQAISFVEPSRILKKHYEGEIVNVSMGAAPLSFSVTPNHRIPIKRTSNSGLATSAETTAKDLVTRRHVSIPVSGFSSAKGPESLSYEDKVRIIVQADGHIPTGDYRNGNHCGYRKCTVNLKRERKIERIVEILPPDSYNYTVLDSGYTSFYIKCPPDISKDFSWIDLSTVSADWARAFLDELVHWDGHERESGLRVYSSVNESNVDTVQALAALCGMRTKKQKPNIKVNTATKDEYSPVYRVSWKEQTHQPLPVNSTKKVSTNYSGPVYCVTVPDTFFMIRHNGNVSVTGNCHHVDSMTRLFRTVIEENPHIWTDDFKGLIYQACRDMVRLEDAFIDTAFATGEVDGLTAEDVKEYIRYIADRRLMQIGLKPNYGVESNPFDWLDWIMSAPTHANFFEQRSTEYGKGTPSDWEEAMAELPELSARNDRKSLSVVIYSKPGCSWCAYAKAVAQSRGISYEIRSHTEYPHKTGGGPVTWPRIFYRLEDGSDGDWIGGATEFVKATSTKG